MLIYFIFLFVLAIIHLWMFARTTNGNEIVLNKKYNKYFWICVIALTLLMGLRATTVGRDMSSYYDRYENYTYMLQALRYRSEFGFNYFNYCLNKLGVSWQLYLVITSAIISTTVLLFFKRYTRRIYFSLFLFMTIGSFTMAMSGLRQTLAVCFCLISFMLIETETYKGKKWKSIFIAVLFWLLAISFHNSAVVFAIYFILRIVKIRLSKKSIILGIVIAALSLVYGRYILSIVNILVPQRYADVSLFDSYAINPLIILIAILISAFCVSFTKVDHDGKYSWTMTVLFLFSLLNIFFTCLSVYQNQLGRLVYYFSNANVVLISKAIDDTSRSNKMIIVPVLGVMCLVFFYLGASGGTLQIDNYLFFWQA